MDKPAHPIQRRDDGWPLCPSCGEDELWSAKPLSVPLEGETWAPGLSCYRCDWDSDETSTQPSRSGSHGAA